MVVHILAQKKQNHHKQKHKSNFIKNVDDQSIYITIPKSMVKMFWLYTSNVSITF